MADNNKIEVKVPDIGGAMDVDVIDIMVKKGDAVSKEQSLVTLEGDKATMDIPSPFEGVVEDVLLKMGDKVSEGSVMMLMSVKTVSDEPAKIAQMETPVELTSPVYTESTATIPAESSVQAVEVPDIGGAVDVDVIDILVQINDEVQKDQALITLEGDKATMDIPAPFAGSVESIHLKLGDKVSQGSLILKLRTSVRQTPVAEKPVSTEPKVSKAFEVAAFKKEPESQVSSFQTNGKDIFASPAVRRLAREFGVNLSEVRGHGRKSRITKEDVQAYVKTKLSAKSQAAGGFSLPDTPEIDFSRFGEIEKKSLNKIKRLTGVNVHRSWISIPHVTQFDEADITDLEAFRKEESDTATKLGYKLTILAFVVKVVCKALLKYPQFNASLDATAENLIYKKYFNVGIAVETPNGLVVPVIKQADKLSVGEVAMDMARLSAKARDKGLMPADMSGGCFTISSLGGIGGTAFTPIVNSPEVAILGLSRSTVKPVYQTGEFVPRLMLPLSLSYDHRVIDGAEAARFTRYVADLLGDVRRVLL